MHEENDRKSEAESRNDVELEEALDGLRNGKGVPSGGAEQTKERCQGGWRILGRRWPARMRREERSPSCNFSNIVFFFGNRRNAKRNKGGRNNS